MWITADDEREAAEVRVLEFLDGGEEGVEVEVGDDHVPSVETALDEIVCDPVRQ
jgi:hypothetical protein